MFEVNGLYIIHMVLNMKITPTSISYVYWYSIYWFCNCSVIQSKAA